MNKKLNFIIGIILIIVSIAIIIIGVIIILINLQIKDAEENNFFEEKREDNTGLTLESIKNAEYYSYPFNKEIKLRNGEAQLMRGEYPFSLGILTDKIALGDLNNDNNEDAVVIFYTSSTVGIVDYNLVAMINEGGKPVYLKGNYPLGDRITINSLVIESGKIILDINTYALRENFSSPPTWRNIVEYKLSNGRLEVIGATNKFEISDYQIASINNSNDMTIPNHKDISNDKELSDLITKNTCLAIGRKDDFCDNIYYIGADIKTVDLNRDGVKELINYPIKLNAYIVPGASGNTLISVYQNTKEGWKNIGSLGGNSYNVEDKKTGEYYDISTYTHMSAGCGIKTYYSWSESDFQYKMTKSYKTGDYCQ